MAVHKATGLENQSAGLASSDNFVASLKLEKLDTDLYRSLNLWKPAPGARAVFGGQIIGQALVAAHMSIDGTELPVHSLHAYFLLPGDPKVPAVYHVSRIRDGRSFATRSVTAKQKGKAIFSAMISFHKPEESVLVHHAPMPDVPEPESLLSALDFAEKLVKANKHKSPKTAEMWANRVALLKEKKTPLEVKYVVPADSLMMSKYTGKDGDPATSMIWFKSKHKLPRLRAAHNCVIAYASDTGMVAAAAKPLGANFSGFHMVASLDHAMWFHTPFLADEWMLYVNESPRAVGGRAIVFGRIYKRTGELAVTVAQELILRIRPPPKQIDSKSGITAKL